MAVVNIGTEKTGTSKILDNYCVNLLEEFEAFFKNIRI